MFESCRAHFSVGVGCGRGDARTRSADGSLPGVLQAGFSVDAKLRCVARSGCRERDHLRQRGLVSDLGRRRRPPGGVAGPVERTARERFLNDATTAWKIFVAAGVWCASNTPDAEREEGSRMTRNKRKSAGEISGGVVPGKRKSAGEISG
jgi:hypothetical protein